MRPIASFVSASILLSTGSIAIIACSGGSSGGAPSSSAAMIASSSAKPSASAFGSDDKPKSVYPVDKAVPPNPLAEKLCAAVHGPERLAASCCKSPAADKPIGLEGECVRTLSMSLAAGATSVDEAEITKCKEAVESAYTGCDWVGTLGYTLPKACEHLVHGAVKPGDACRSSLECPNGQRCLGGGPLDVGKCGSPRPDGAACDLANDVLASYARQDHLEVDHPECTGVCGRRRCAPLAHKGETCSFETQCEEGSRCVGGTCKEGGFPAAGQACESRCAGDARCLKGKCVAPKAKGESCASDLECKGACNRESGAETGECGMRCGGVRLSSPIPARPAPSK